MLFPNFFEKTYPKRNLAYLDEDGCLVKQKGKFTCLGGFIDFANALFDDNLQCFIDNILYCKWLPELVEHAEVLCEKKGGPKCVRIPGPRNSARWLVQGSSWNVKHFTEAALSRLQALFTLCRVGVRPTLGSLGAALMRRFWPADAIRHGEPNRSCRRALHQFGTGGRAELIKPTYARKAWCLDETNAYADAAARWGMPTGTAQTIIDGEGLDDYAAWYALCEISYPADLDLAPFGMREGDDPVVYPRARGSYLAYLWDFQYRSALEAGCHIRVGSGWGWFEMTYDLARWVYEMGILRDEDPMIKSAIVRALGRFNMLPEKYVLALYPQRLEDYPVVLSDGHMCRLFVHTLPDKTKWQGPHWYYLNATRVADAVYRLARSLLPHVLGINFDAVYVDLDCPGVENFKPKSETVTGEVGRLMITIEEMNKNRWLRARDEQGRLHLTTPGQPHLAECECVTCQKEAA